METDFNLTINKSSTLVERSLLRLHCLTLRLSRVCKRPYQTLVLACVVFNYNTTTLYVNRIALARRNAPLVLLRLTSCNRLTRNHHVIYIRSETCGACRCATSVREMSVVKLQMYTELTTERERSLGFQ